MLELRPDVAQELMTLRTGVPGLDGEHTTGALMAMGVGLDMERAFNLVTGKAAAIQAAPYACPELADLNRAAAEVAGEIKNVPAPLQKGRGFALVAENINLTGFLPTNVKGFGSISSGDTAGLIGLLRMVPPFNNNALVDDGSVKTLPDGTIPMLNNVAYGAKADQSVVFAVGAGSSERVGELLAASPQSDPPLLLMSYDMGRMGELTRAGDGLPRLDAARDEDPRSIFIRCSGRCITTCARASAASSCTRR